jgi:hypothetical protein
MHGLALGFKKKFPQTANNLVGIAFSHRRREAAAPVNGGKTPLEERLGELAGNLTANPAAAPAKGWIAATASKNLPS